MFEDVQLRLPGPTPVPPRVARAMTKPMIGHRSSDFSALYSRLESFGKRLFGTSGDLFFLTGSGTSGMETAVANVVSPGDKVLLLTCGNFGDRFGQIISAYQGNLEKVEVEWGLAIDPDLVVRKLRAAGPYKAVFVTHNETSTGVVNDLAGIGEAVHEYGRGALLVVDSVSGLGGQELRMDDWHIDIVVTGSQKALMLPPGLALIGVSQRAWKVIEANTSPRFYFNLLKYKASAGKDQTPYTPNIAHLFGLEESFAAIEEEGLEEVYRRHHLMKKMTRAAMQALGLELFAPEEFASSTVTAVKGPRGIDVEQMRKVVKEKFGVQLAGGQGSMKGKLFRIGHMGYANPRDILTIVASLECALKYLGYEVQLGSGVGAAQAVLLQEVQG